MDKLKSIIYTPLFFKAFLLLLFIALFVGVKGIRATDTNIFTGGTYTVSTTLNANNPVFYAFDGSLSTQWASARLTMPQWIQYDLGAGRERALSSIRFYPFYSTCCDAGDPVQTVRTYKILGSNDNINFDQLYLGETSSNTQLGWVNVDIGNTTPYRIYRFEIDSTWSDVLDHLTGLVEWEGFDAYNPPTPTPTPPSGTSIYPPEQTSTYIKATSTCLAGGAWNFAPYYTTDPSKSLVGDWEGRSWYTNVNCPGGSLPYQNRFHIDLGTPNVINRIYYENAHYFGMFTDSGIQHFTFWGSNDADSFNDLNYTDDTGWIQLSTDNSAFKQHIPLDIADPQYINVTNTSSYRYYAFKFADNFNFNGEPRYSIRRLELQYQEVNQAPIANAGPDQTVFVGQIVNFDGSESSDPDGNQDIQSYNWNFGDTSTGSGSTTTHVYDTSGTFSVGLTVTDYAGASNSDALVVTVQTPAEATESLIDLVEVFNDEQGIQNNSLDAKLQNTIDSLNAQNADNRQDAINKLNAFISATLAQSGGKLTVDQADILIQAAQQIILYLESTDTP